MRQIRAPQAHAITGGSPDVLVGDIDTGTDFNHPDLVQNIDVANSANCVSGVPVQGTAAQDDNGHGTYTAGTIAAASNGIGIVGVAPNVKIAGIKAGNSAGFFFPEAMIASVFGHMSPGRMQAYLSQTTNTQPCPTSLPTTPLAYDVLGAGTQAHIFYPCQGGPGSNSWYGNGRVDALNAVNHTTGN